MHDFKLPVSNTQKKIHLQAKFYSKTVIQINLFQRYNNFQA